MTFPQFISISLSIVLTGICADALKLDPHYALIKKSDLVRRSAPDGFTPHDPPINWVALGDSYTAGPGAGNAYGDLPDNGCLRNSGSYAPQLHANFPWHEQDGFQFLACTGYTSTDVLANTIDLIDDDNDFMVMTLGGNDIGFSQIIKDCLVKPAGIGSGDCDTTLQQTRDKINSDDLHENMFRVYGKIFDKMPRRREYQVIQILYSRFFDDTTTWCNDQTFGIWPLYKPLLTIELRRKLNVLSDQLNARLLQIAKDYVSVKRGGQHGGQIVGPSPGWESRSRLFVIDPDDQEHEINQQPYGLFDGHRFCEQGVEDPGFTDDRIWFFNRQGHDTGGASAFSKGIDVNTCATDRKYDSNLAFSYQCDIARYFAGPGANSSVQVTLPEGLVQSFHPKTVGFAAIKRLLSNVLRKVRQPIGNVACTDAEITAAQNAPVQIQADADGTYSASTTCSYSTASSATITAAASEPTSWKDPYGPVPSGSFTFFILPARWQPSNTLDGSTPDDKTKRWDDPPIPPQPVANHKPANATLHVYTQNGAGYQNHGPLTLNCFIDQAAYQTFDVGTIGLPYSISISAGHACSVNAKDNNLDNLHVKYADQYLDIPKANHKSCAEHHDGVSCEIKVHPA